MSIQIIDDDISAKGCAYIIIGDNSLRESLEILEKETDLLFEKGAKKVCARVAPSDKALDRNGFTVGKFNFTPHCSIDVLTRDTYVIDDTQLILEPLTKKKSVDYIRTYNEAFALIDNVSYLTESDTDEALEDEGISSGFLIDHGTDVGIYEIENGDIPEITALAIHPDYQGKGLGKKGIRTLISKFCSKGFSKVKLTVASTNKIAYKLYLNEGFAFEKELGYWYKTECHKDQK